MAIGVDMATETVTIGDYIYTFTIYTSSVDVRARVSDTTKQSYGPIQSQVTRPSTGVS